MITALLIRAATTDQGTFGLLSVPGWTCHTVELPWRDNARQRSCIPVGSYIVIPHRSPRFGRCLWVQDVPARSGILLHGGNYAGDVEVGWRSHSFGCILPGLRRGVLDGQQAVLQSTPAVLRLVDIMLEPFKLMIEQGGT